MARSASSSTSLAIRAAYAHARNVNEVFGTKDPSTIAPNDEDVAAFHSGLDCLPASLRPAVLAQLSFRTLLCLYGENLLNHISFEMLVGAIKQEEDVFRCTYFTSTDKYRHSTLGLNSRGGLVFTLLDPPTHTLEAALCAQHEALPERIDKYQILSPDAHDKPWVRLGDSQIVSLEPPKLVSSKETFLHRFRAFTNGQLAKLDWTNIFTLGGAVSTPLFFPSPDTPLPTIYRVCRQLSEVSEYYQEMFPLSDIDLYLYGLSSESEARLKLQSVLRQINEARPQGVILNFRRAARTLTITNADLTQKIFFRPIQIILSSVYLLPLCRTSIIDTGGRRFETLEEALMEVDLNISTVGFDGANVVAIPRFIIAARWKVNALDSAVSISEKFKWRRLEKYSKRGFPTLLPLHIRVKDLAEINSMEYETEGLKQFMRLVPFGKLCLVGTVRPASLSLSMLTDWQRGIWIEESNWNRICSRLRHELSLLSRLAKQPVNHVRLNQLEWDLIDSSNLPLYYSETRVEETNELVSKTLPLAPSFSAIFHNKSTFYPNEWDPELEHQVMRWDDYGELVCITPVVNYRRAMDEALLLPIQRYCNTIILQAFLMNAWIPEKGQILDGGPNDLRRAIETLPSAFGAVNTRLVPVTYRTMEESWTIEDFWTKLAKGVEFASLAIGGHLWALRIHTALSPELAIFELNWLGRQQASETDFVLPFVPTNFIISLANNQTGDPAQVTIMDGSFVFSQEHKRWTQLLAEKITYDNGILGPVGSSRHFALPNRTITVKLVLQVLDVQTPVKGL